MKLGSSVAHKIDYNLLVFLPTDNSERPFSQFGTLGAFHHAKYSEAGCLSLCCLRASVNQLPTPLRPTPSRSAQLLGLGAELDTPNSIWPLFTQYSLGRLVSAPLPDGSVFWSVSRDESSLTDEQLYAFSLLGRKAIEHAQLDETNDDAANRLRRMDALEGMVPALDGVLDVRGGELPLMAYGVPYAAYASS